MGSDQELDYNPGPAMKRFGGCRHYLPRRNPIGTIDRIQLTLCREVVCSHWLVVDGWGHSWESVLPACQSCLPRPLSFSTPRFQQAQASHRIDELFGAGAICKVRNQGEDREVESGVGGDGYAQEPTEGPRHRFVSFRHDGFGQLQAW